MPKKERRVNRALFVAAMGGLLWSAEAPLARHGAGHRVNWASPVSIDGVVAIAIVVQVMHDGVFTLAVPCRLNVVSPWCSDFILMCTART